MVFHFQASQLSNYLKRINQQHTISHFGKVCRGEVQSVVLQSASLSRELNIEVIDVVDKKLRVRDSKRYINSQQ
jgi:hypothetical protein